MLTKDQKLKIFKTHGGSEQNTGSSEAQIAMFTERIAHMTEHLKNNKHDVATEKSLVKLVGKRRSLLDYLKERDINRYRAIIKKLDIRK